MGWKRVAVHVLFWIGVFLFEAIQTSLTLNKIDSLFVVLTLREVLTIILIHYCLTAYAIPKLLFNGKLFAFVLSGLFALFVMILSMYYSFYSINNLRMVLPQQLSMLINFYLKRPFLSTLVDPVMIWNTILLHYTLFFSILIKVTKDFFTSNIKRLHYENEIIKLEKENIKLELNFLKSQIHPHFFFNTLNNIYSLITDKDEVAADIIVRLSNLMRYSLYESNTDKISLKRELEFISDYVELEKIRHKEHVAIHLNIQGNIVDELEIPPLILVTFVENAFKHGVNNSVDASFVQITINVKKTELLFSIKNSKPLKLHADNVEGGIGIMNVKRRLDLMYNNRYLLKIQNTPLEYIANLNIKMHEKSTLCNSG
jgi:sensor histidine kinase YesM